MQHMPNDPNAPPARRSYIEFAIRDGFVPETIPLAASQQPVDFVPCLNPKCNGGGFRISPNPADVVTRRCFGYEKVGPNVIRLCNYWIRYRVRSRG